MTVRVTPFEEFIAAFNTEFYDNRGIENHLELPHVDVTEFARTHGYYSVNEYCNEDSDNLNLKGGWVFFPMTVPYVYLGDMAGCYFVWNDSENLETDGLPAYSKE